MQNPFQAQAMIHSLNSKRDVLILSFEDINHCRAVFGNKLCTAVYNPYAGLFYRMKMAFKFLWMFSRMLCCKSGK